jgi:two-component sensor histidine kinase
MWNTGQFWQSGNEALLSAGAKTNEAEHALLKFEHLPQSAHSPSVIIVDGQEHRTIEICERELISRRHTEIQLREALAREQALLRQKDDLIQHQALLSQESDHRLLNGLQMIVSLLSLQGRASENAEVASQLAGAANRVATIGRIHRRLHSFDGMQTFAIKQYLHDICADFSTMLSSGRPERMVVVEGIDINLPAATAIPLGFIASELITNAVKYGTGRITVSLERNSEKKYALTVCNDGPALPDDFDPAQRKGLGMRIIRSFVKQIGGELRVGRGDCNQGTRFTVLFF